MNSTAPHAAWTIGYFVCWAAAIGGAVGLVASIGWAAYGPRGIDDDVALLLGIPAGAVLGVVVARATRANRLLHRRLMWTGAAVAALAGIAAAASFSSARALQGQGPFAGLGEALLGLAALIVVGIAGAMFGAGTCGYLATRSMPQ